MSPEMTKLIALLKKEIGYSQGWGGTKFGKWYNNVEQDADYSSQPWCNMFLSWGAHQLGFQDWFGQFAWTVGHARWFQEQGAWGDTPEPGAVVFYDWGGSRNTDAIDHVGLVTDVRGDKIITIEGNIDGKTVAEKSRSQDKVVGYGYPDQIRERLQSASGENTQWDEEGFGQGDELTFQPEDTPKSEHSPKPAHTHTPPTHTSASPAASPTASPTGAGPASTAPETPKEAAQEPAKGPAQAPAPETQRESAKPTKSHPAEVQITTAATARQTPDEGFPGLTPQYLSALILIMVVSIAYLKLRGTRRHAAAGPAQQASSYRGRHRQRRHRRKRR